MSSKSGQRNWKQEEELDCESHSAPWAAARLDLEKAGPQLKSQFAGEPGRNSKGSQSFCSPRTRPDSWGQASRSAFLHVVVIFGSLAPPRRNATAFAPNKDLSPGQRHGAPATPGTPTCSLRALPSSPAGQQALMNKRPIRGWGLADEWTFRFQAWHRFGFPGAQGRASRSCLPEPGHCWGQRVLKTPTSPSLRGWLGKINQGAEPQTLHPGSDRHLSVVAQHCGQTSSTPPAAAPRRHPNKSSADC